MISISYATATIVLIITLIVGMVLVAVLDEYFGKPVTGDCDCNFCLGDQYRWKK